MTLQIRGIDLGSRSSAKEEHHVKNAIELDELKKAGISNFVYFVNSWFWPGTACQPSPTFGFRHSACTVAGGCLILDLYQRIKLGIVLHSTARLDLHLNRYPFAMLNLKPPGRKSKVQLKLS